MIKIPYGRTSIDIEIPPERILGVLKPKINPKLSYGYEEQVITVIRALENPVGSPRLRELSRNKKKVLLITSDHTRPVPSKITLPLLLEEIRYGNPEAEITILVATGYHRKTTRKEMEELFGNDLLESESFVIHDSNSDELVYKGLLPSGGELWLNSLVDNCDLLISEGFIEPHFFAGFSGGRKSVLPGISGKTTILANHCKEFINHPKARTGVLKGNPIHRDMVYAAEKAGLSFIMNVILDSEKRIIAAYAGDAFKAHSKGCASISRKFRVKGIEADIVVASNGGYPLDLNIYQAVKGLTAAESCVRRGGTIIMVAECSDGHGGKDFFDWFSWAASPRIVKNIISDIPREETLADQWQAQILARVLLKAEVIMVSSLEEEIVKDLHMKYAPDLKTAMEMADGHKRKKAGVVVIPDGVSVIVR